MKQVRYALGSFVLFLMALFIGWADDLSLWEVLGVFTVICLGNILGYIEGALVEVGILK